MKKKYHTVENFPKFNRKIVEIAKFDIPNTHNTWPSTGTSIQSDGVKLIHVYETCVFFLLKCGSERNVHNLTDITDR